MSMDMANFLIRSFRPHFQRQLVDYERSKFQEILEETPSKYQNCLFVLKLGENMVSLTS